MAEREALPAEAPEAAEVSSSAFAPEQILEYRSRLGTSLEEAAGYLSGVLQLPNYESDALSAIRLDLAAYTLTFAQEAGHGPHCTASLLQVAHTLLEATAGGASIEELQASFKTLMLQRTSPAPGTDSGKFSPDQVAVVAQFFARTFFRHWRLYAHCLRQAQEVAECSVGLLVETALVPSFEGALSQEEWQAAQAAEAQAAVATAQAAEEAAADAAAQAQRDAAAAAEEEAERLRQEQLARKPATLEQAVEHLIALRLDAEKQLLAADYHSKEELLLKKIAELEARAQQAPKK